MDLSVIIPIYNEEGNIPLMIDRLRKSVASANIESVEYIFVNDGSKDSSISIIKSLAGSDPSIKYINLSRNFGHQIAVSAGIDFCSGDAVVIIDADLQDPPELIPELYLKLHEGYQVVYAKRKVRHGENPIRMLVYKIYYRLLARITSISIPVDTGDFRIIDKKIVKCLREMPEQEKFLRGQISWLGFNQTFLEYDRDGRNAGETGYTFKKLFKLAFDGITSFSNFPLRFATIAGFSVSGLSFILILYALFSYFFNGNTPQGWTSLMITILFIGGIQLIGIGIIGEYISRISANVRKRPLYIVSENNIEQ